MTEDPRKTFSKSARRYLESTDHSIGVDLERIRSSASDILPSATLDVATGAGFALRAAAPFSAHCIALDLTLEMLEVAREHLGGLGLDHVSYLVARSHDLPIKERTIDLLTCRIACHHFADIPGFLAEAGRVLSRGGRLIIIDSVVPDEEEAGDFLNRIEKIRDPSHIRSLTLRRWGELFNGAGFELTREETFFRVHSFREWADRVGLSGERRRELEEGFRSASDEIKKTFRIEINRGEEILSYTDTKAIFELIST